MSLPRLHIAIPTFNRCKYLRCLLESIASLPDSFDGVSIQVFDNGSTDETPQVCAAFRERLPFLSVSCSPQNQGGTANIQTALHSGAGSDYTWLLSDYTALDPGCIDLLRATLREHSPELLCALRASCNPQFLRLPMFAAFGQILADPLAEIYFLFSNISSVIVRASLPERAAGQIEALRSLSYPHLGVWSGLSASDTVAVVRLPFFNQSQPPRRAYAWFDSGVLDFSKTISRTFLPDERSKSILYSTIRLRAFQRAILIYFLQAKAGYVPDSIHANAITQLNDSFPCPHLFLFAVRCLTATPDMLCRLFLTTVYLFHKGKSVGFRAAFQMTVCFWHGCKTGHSQTKVQKYH